MQHTHITLKRGFGSDNSYTTQDELIYLRHAGLHHRDWELSALESSERALTGYIEAAERRYNWGDIDKQTVVLEAHRMLQEVRRQKEVIG